MILNRDHGSIPSPGGPVYTPEQAEDLRAALEAERMAETLLEYAQAMRLAAIGSIARRGFHADARAAIHAHPGLAALLDEARR